MPTAKQIAGGLYEVLDPSGTRIGTGTREFAEGKGVKFPTNPNVAWQYGGSFPTEPAVISSDSVDREIADAKARLKLLGDKGTTIGPDGTAYYADKSMVPAPQDSVYNDKTGQYEYDGKKYGVAQFYGQDDGTPDEDYTAIMSLFDPLKASLDASTLATVNSIQDNFKELKAEQRENNRRAEQSRAQTLLLAGTSRYAPLAAESMKTAQLEYSMKQIKDLDDQENRAIAKARQAQSEGKERLLVSAMAMAEDARTKKQAKAEEVAESLREANIKLRDQKIQASRDSAVADLISQGVTDPAQMLNFLNSYEDGSSTGGDFTADEISKAVKALTVEGKKAEDLTADLETFNYLRDNNLLPADIANVDPKEQYFAYLQALREAKSAPSGGFTLGKNQVRYDEKGKPIAWGPAGDEEEEAPTWDEYKKAALLAAGVSQFMRADEEQLKQQFQNDFPAGQIASEFTDSEKRKLEQAGLLDAMRPEQLDFLYGDEEDEDDSPF